MEEKSKNKPQKKPTLKPKVAAQEISVSLDVSGFQRVLDQVYNDGRLSGFQDGVKYIVTLAENLLVEHQELGSRAALTKDSRLMPTWWIATLIEALYYEPPFTSRPRATHHKAEGGENG